jgi:hypothetical protein
MVTNHLLQTKCCFCFVFLLFFFKSPFDDLSISSIQYIRLIICLVLFYFMLVQSLQPVLFSYCFTYAVSRFDVLFMLFPGLSCWYIHKCNRNVIMWHMPSRILLPSSYTGQCLTQCPELSTRLLLSGWNRYRLAGLSCWYIRCFNRTAEWDRMYTVW